MRGVFGKYKHPNGPVPPPLAGTYEGWRIVRDEDHYCGAPGQFLRIKIEKDQPALREMSHKLRRKSRGSIEADVTTLPLRWQRHEVEQLLADKQAQEPSAAVRWVIDSVASKGRQVETREGVCPVALIIILRKRTILPRDVPEDAGLSGYQRPVNAELFADQDFAAGSADAGGTANYMAGLHARAHPGLQPPYQEATIDQSRSQRHSAVCLEPAARAERGQPYISSSSRVPPERGPVGEHLSRQNAYIRHSPNTRHLQDESIRGTPARTWSQRPSTGRDSIDMRARHVDEFPRYSRASVPQAPSLEYMAERPREDWTGSYHAGEAIRTLAPQQASNSGVGAASSSRIHGHNQYPRHLALPVRSSRRTAHDTSIESMYAGDAQGPRFPTERPQLDIQPTLRYRSMAPNRQSRSRESNIASSSWVRRQNTRGSDWSDTGDVNVYSDYESESVDSSTDIENEERRGIAPAALSPRSPPRLVVAQTVYPSFTNIPRRIEAAPSAETITYASWAAP